MYIGGSVSYTAQIAKHELKAGGSIQRWTVRHYGITGSTSLNLLMRSSPDLARNPDS